MRDFLFKNLGLKMFSLIISLGLWFYLTVEREAEVGYSVKLIVKNVPENLELVGEKIDHVTVWVEGLRRVLMKLSPEKMVVPVDLKNAKEGAIIYPLDSNSIKVPEGIRISRVNPSVVSFTLEKIIDKMVKITPFLSGEVPRGYEIENIRTVPARVKIMGRKSVVEKLEDVFTYPIDVTSLTQDLNFEVPVDVDRSRIKADSSDRMVRVEIKVKEIVIEKEIGDVPVTAGEAMGTNNIEISPSSARLQVRGPEISVDKLGIGDIRVFINSPKRMKLNRTYESRAVVELPKNIKLLKIEPSLFRVRLIKEGKK